MKIDIYTLLGMIKDGKAPKKILFKEQIYEYTRRGYYDSDNGETLFDTYYIDEILNDEVKILETTITYKKDDKIKKLPYYDYSWRNQTMELSFENRKRLDYAEKRLNDYHEKINEIIDHLNNKQ